MLQHVMLLVLDIESRLVKIVFLIFDYRGLIFDFFLIIDSLPVTVTVGLCAFSPEHCFVMEFCRHTCNTLFEEACSEVKVFAFYGFS